MKFEEEEEDEEEDQSLSQSTKLWILWFLFCFG
jgi:hypothetical protein